MFPDICLIATVVVTSAALVEVCILLSAILDQSVIHGYFYSYIMSQWSDFVWHRCCITIPFKR